MSQRDTQQPTDYSEITDRQREAWTAGDFHEVARQNVAMAEELVRAVDPHAGERVLDVGCGSGTAALVAARRYCEVAGIDYVPALIERADQRAAAAGYDAEFRVGDAQELPFPDDSFDAVISVFGAQFAPDQARVASELCRVCRPGGTIGLASPVPVGWTGDYFATLSTYAPPPPGVEPASRWGTRAGLEELLGDGVRAIETDPRLNLGYFRSMDHAVEVFTTYFGPTVTALETLDEDDREQLRADIRAVFTRHNRATDGTVKMECEYMLSTAVCA